MASSPINRRKQKRNYFIAGVLSYILILFFACHMAKAEGEGLLAFPDAINHLVSHPFDIFPINIAFIRPALLLGMFPVLLLYAEYLKKRDLRPSVEKGSAQWNEDIREYNKKYTEMRVSVPAFVQKAVDAIIKIPILGKIFKFFWKSISKHFGKLDKTPKSKNMIFQKNLNILPSMGILIIASTAF